MHLVHTLQVAHSPTQNFKASIFNDKPMRKNLLISLAFGAVLLTTGCVSIMSGTSQNVSVQSKPDGAKATFYNRKGEVVSAQQTPFMISLKRSEKYKLKIEKEQYEPLEVTLKKGLNGWYLGNVIFGGILGLLIIDPATGAMWTYQEPIRAELALVGSGQASVLVKPRWHKPSVPGGKSEWY
ncbi:MAG: hypothetical protein QOJ40_2709 [Verrucomicrobiota bacterium]